MSAKTEKELRGLKRAELLEIIAGQRKQIEDLHEKLAEAEERLSAGCVTIDLKGASSVEEAKRIIRGVLAGEPAPEEKGQEP